MIGRFLYKSSTENEYVLIVYHVYSNAILGTSIKNRQEATITQAWIKLENILSNCNESTNTCALDDETSFELKNAMRKKHITFQMVPPCNHRANFEERTIQTFKKCFKAGISTLYSDFHIVEWDQLLPQAFLTLNSLQPPNVNPQLSVHVSFWTI